MNYEKKFYPSDNLIADVYEGLNCLPESLRLLLGVLIKSDVKINSQGQCIVTAARPKSCLLC